VGARALGRRPWGQQHTFCSYFKHVLSRNLDQSMLKMRNFEKKNVKIVSTSGAPPPNPRLPPAAWASLPDPRVITPAYYYSFVEFISSTKMRFIPLVKETKNK